MKINIGREDLLPALVAVANVVERRQSLPILSNLLVNADSTGVSITATDMEVEVVARANATVIRQGSTTIPARKWLDICKSLDPSSSLEIEEKGGKVKVVSNRSRFSLASLPASDYPSMQLGKDEISIQLDPKILLELISNTQFAMAHQDVRYYLNGLLFEFSPNSIRAVATDGHRLAMCERNINTKQDLTRQVIVPRKGISEILRLVSHTEKEVLLGLSGSQIRLTLDGNSVAVKLVDGKFPDYERVLPKDIGKVVVTERELTKSALHRTSILSNEKFRGVRLVLSKSLLKTAAHNPEQEEAEEELEVEYDGDDLEIGFNVSYLLDVLGVLQSQKVRFGLSDANSSCLLQDPDDDRSKYVIMPMRL